MNSSVTDHAVVPEAIEQPFQITEVTNTQKITNIYLSEELDSPDLYIEVIDKLRNASSQDLFYIYLNTPGGYVDTGVQIINAMNDSKARIITVLDGTVCSMGSLIFLAADEYIVHENCRLMFHNYSGGTYGKGHEQIAQLTSTVDWFTNMFTEICFPFLTEEEINEVIVGQDMWLSSEDTKVRLESVVAYGEALQKQAEEEEAEKFEKNRKKDLLAELKKIETKEKREAAKITKTKNKSKVKKKVGGYQIA